MTTRASRALISIIAAGLACGSGTFGPIAVPRLEHLNGGFEYRAWDAGGSLLLVGTVMLQTGADSVVSGTWDIQRAPGADPDAPVGPQVGTGTLAGRFAAEQTMIDLNPGWADNNVFLVAALAQDGDLIGEWEHSTLLGPVGRGRFELRRIGP